jgi:alanine racemase
MAVVKSDGYGHGAAKAARVFLGAGAQWLAVASVDEGVQLRAQVPGAPLLVLGPAPERALPAALANKLDITVTTAAQIDAAARAGKESGGKLRVHLKIDSGMHRLGVSPNQFIELLNEIKSNPNLSLVSIFSHLAKADELEFTRKQNETFNSCLAKAKEVWPHLLLSDGGDVFVHLASGDAARRFPFTHHDMVRVGLNLYGLESRVVSQVVKPAMAVRARINQIRELEAGESIGYNLTWTAEKPTRIASVPIGYADGVPRNLSNKMSGLLHGKRVQQCGTISMDQMLFDINDAPQAREGDVITLIGKDGNSQLYFADWAQTLGTITYELACAMRLRLPRIYKHGQSGK